MTAAVLTIDLGALARNYATLSRVAGGAAGVRSRPQRRQPDDLLGSLDCVERSAAARAQVPGVRVGWAVPPYAGAAR